MSRIFISYSREDEAFAKQVSSFIRELGGQVWIDQEDIPSGVKWSTAIQDGLSQCDIMIVIISPDSMASQNVEDEWQYFLDQKKAIIPILLRPTNINFQLNRIQHIDFHSKSKYDGFRLLYAELQRKGVELKPFEESAIRETHEVGSSAGRIYETMVAFFEDDSWSFHAMEGRPILSMAFTGNNGNLQCYAQAREDQEQFVFYSVCPVRAPEPKRPAIAEFITRANYGMIIGNFEMDYSDGEIRYKSSIDVEGVAFDKALIKQMVYANVIIMDRYMPGIMRVIYSNGEPAAEIQAIENPES